MADNHFDLVLVWDNLGGAVRVNAGGRATVTDPVTGDLVTVVQEGQSVTVVTADSDGRVSFVAQQGQVTLTSGGLETTATSAEAAQAGASNVTAAQAAQAAAESARDAAIAARDDTTTGLAGKVGKTDLWRSIVDAGAVGDGSTDNAATIQSVVDAIAADGGGIVIIPKGTFNISTTILLKPGVRVIGRAKTGCKIFCTGNFAAFANATPTTRIDNVGLESIYLDRSVAAPSTPIIDWTYISNSTIRDVNIRQLTARGTSVGLQIGAFSYYNRIEGVQVRGTSTGFLLQNAGNGNTFVGNNLATTVDNGYIIDGTNSTHLFGAAAENVDSVGFLMRNGSKYNALIGCRAEDIPTCFKVDGTGTAALSNHIYGSLTFPRAAGTSYDVSRVANVVIDENSVNEVVPYTSRSFVDVYKSSAQSALTAGTWTKVTFSTEVSDHLNEFASSTFTAAIAGLYQVEAGALFPTTASGNHLQLGVYVNGSLWKIIADNWTSNTSAFKVAGSCLLKLAAGDTVEVWANASVSVGITSGGGNTYLQIMRR